MSVSNSRRDQGLQLVITVVAVVVVVVTVAAVAAGRRGRRRSPRSPRRLMMVSISTKMFLSRVHQFVAVTYLSLDSKQALIMFYSMYAVLRQIRPQDM